MCPLKQSVLLLFQSFIPTLCDFSRTKANQIVLATTPTCSNQRKIYFVIIWQSKITLIRKVMMSLLSNKHLSMLLMLRTPLRLQSVPLIQANSTQTAAQEILEMCYFLRGIVTTCTDLGTKHHTGLICYKPERVTPGSEAFHP